MFHIGTRRRPAVAAALVLLPASLGLAACGGSSSTTTTKASTSASASTATPGGATTPGSTTHPGLTPQGEARLKTLRACLQKDGITLPQRTPGQRPGGTGGFLGAGHGPQLPKGMTRAQYEAAIKKCGGGAFGSPAFRDRRFRNPATKQALTKFADCMRKNGVNVPEPNTSGSGPIFDTKGIDTASTQFKSAETTCAAELRGAFRPGAAGAPPSTGAPGAG
jgi:hypothetical protein